MSSGGPDRAYGQPAGVAAREPAVLRRGLLRRLLRRAQHRRRPSRHRAEQEHGGGHAEGGRVVHRDGHDHDEANWTELWWYADEWLAPASHRDGPGTACLLYDLADIRNHRHHGLVGALVVEPGDVRPCTPAGTGDPATGGSATSDPATGGSAAVEAWSGVSVDLYDEQGQVVAQESVVLVQDGLRLFVNGHPDLPVPDVVPGDDPEDSGHKGINYRSGLLHRGVPGTARVSHRSEARAPDPAVAAGARRRGQAAAAHDHRARPVLAVRTVGGRRAVGCFAVRGGARLGGDLRPDPEHAGGPLRAHRSGSGGAPSWVSGATCGWSERADRARGDELGRASQRPVQLTSYGHAHVVRPRSRRTATLTPYGHAHVVRRPSAERRTSSVHTRGRIGGRPQPRRRPPRGAAARPSLPAPDVRRDTDHHGKE